MWVIPDECDHCKRYQSQNVVVGVLCMPIFPLVDVFFSHLRNKIRQKQLHIILLNVGIRFVKLFVKEVLHFFVSIFDRCIRTNYAYVEGGYAISGFPLTAKPTPLMFRYQYCSISFPSDLLKGGDVDAIFLQYFLYILSGSWSAHGPGVPNYYLYLVVHLLFSKFLCFRTYLTIITSETDPQFTIQKVQLKNGLGLSDFMTMQTGQENYP
uniref:Uncharacterized protein n=1 Tax=Megaselia scalaris TaxID=36166 RepID=T1GMK2_MEGSC